MKPRILRTYVRQLTAAGYDVAELLGDAGITLESIEALAPIAADNVASIIDTLATRLPECAALQAGKYTQVGDLGLVGYRQLFSRSFREAIDVWIRFSVLTSHPFAGKFAVDGARWQLEYRPNLPLTSRALRFCSDEALSSLQTLLGNFFGAEIPSISIHLPFPGTDALSRSYAEIGYDSVIFDAPYLAIEGDSGCLDRSLICIDSDVRALCENQCQTMLSLAIAEVGFATRVEHALRLYDSLPTAHVVAARLGVSRRTLHRELAAEGTSFHRILDRVRRERAELLFASGKLALKEIAWQLGFADPSGLRRAARGWTGTTLPDRDRSLAA